MSWNTELLRKDAKPIVCMEIILSSQTLYIANTALMESDKYWSPRLESLSPITRAVDLTQRQMSVGDLTATLINNMPDHDDIGYWPTTLDADELINAPIKIYLKFEADDGTIVSRQLYAGLCQPTNLTESEFKISIKPSYRTKLKLLQRQANVIAFPNIDSHSESHPHAVILGSCSNATGAVEAHCIDSGNVFFMVAQHAVNAINNVYRYRDKTLTNLVGVGKVLSATDGEGHKYAYVDVSTAHQAGDEYYADIDGLERSGSLEENPARFLQEILTNADCWNLDSSELDTDSFDDAATVVAARWTTLTGLFGGVIGVTHGELQNPDNQWELAQTIARSFDYTLVITREGKIALKSIDTINTVSTTIPIYSQENGDMTPSLISINYQPFPQINEVRGVYKNKHSLEHSGATEGYLLGTNVASQSLFGVLIDQQWVYQFVRDPEPLQASNNDAGGVLNNQLLLRSGKTKYVTWTVPGLWGLQDNSDIGDAVAITVDDILGAWDQKQVRIISISADLLAGTVTLVGATIGDQVGAIEFSGENTVTLTPSEDTYVYNLAGASVLGAEDTVQHWEFRFETPQWHKRAAFRFDISSIPGGATIESASLQFYCITAVNSRPGSAKDLSLRQLNSTTWDETTSTWNAFDGSGGWNDGIHSGGVNLAPVVFMGVGFQTFVLNSDFGIPYIQSRLGVDNELQFTFQPGSQMEPSYDERYTLASKDHATVSWRPVLTITYTT